MKYKKLGEKLINSPIMKFYSTMDLINLLKYGLLTKMKIIVNNCLVKNLLMLK